MEYHFSWAARYEGDAYEVTSIERARMNERTSELACMHAYTWNDLHGTRLRLYHSIVIEYIVVSTAARVSYKPYNKIQTLINYNFIQL